MASSIFPPGALLSAAGIVGVVYAIIEEPAYSWHAQVLVSLPGGAALTGLFALRQYTSTAPLIDLRLFRNRLFSWGTIAFAVISFAMTGTLFILTPYLQSVQGNDAQGTGLRLLPMIAVLIAAAVGNATLAARIGVKFVIPACPRRPATPPRPASPARTASPHAYPDQPGSW